MCGSAGVHCAAAKRWCVVARGRSEAGGWLPVRSGESDGKAMGVKYALLHHAHADVIVKP